MTTRRCLYCYDQLGEETSVLIRFGFSQKLMQVKEKLMIINKSIQKQLNFIGKVSGDPLPLLFSTRVNLSGTGRHPPDPVR